MKTSAFAMMMVALTMASSSATAKNLIVCTGGGGIVIVSLADKRAYGHTLDCLHGGDFVSDMTPCAARNG